MLSFVYQNNMADEVVKSNDNIKVTVKTPRDKKEVYVEGNGSIRQVLFVYCGSMYVNCLFIIVFFRNAEHAEPENSILLRRFLLLVKFDYIQRKQNV